jgi:four helix bundle protein
MQSDNLIVDLTEEFALIIISYTDEIKKAKYFSIADQLLRCGTSIGANVAEAQDAESKADFRHKLKVANKEANETR